MDMTQTNIAIVRSFYEGGTDSDGSGYGSIFASDFRVTAPNYLPWGGTSNLKEYLEDVLPQVTKAIDFSTLTYDSIIGQNENVVVVVNVTVLGTLDTIKISEHWQLKDGKAVSLWVAYFEPKPLLNRLNKNDTAEVKKFIIS